MVAGRPVADQGLSQGVAMFLHHEAELLDDWCLDEWVALFDDDGRYEIPATNAPRSDSATHQFLIAENADQVRARIRRLESRNAHAENPRSRTRRLITNVRAVPLDEERVAARANFMVHRIRRGAHTIFVGEYRHVLRRAPEPPGFAFLLRRAELDLEQLAGDGRISIVL
jgi:p-cumate 2,3-dioxygenase beta subunit